MERTELIPAQEFCNHYQVSFTFMTSLYEAGLIDMTIVEGQQHLNVDNLCDVEKLVRLHTELEINEEGVEAIAHLLQRMKDMQNELKLLRQQLRLRQ